GFAVSAGYGINVQRYLLSRDWEWYVQDTWKASPRLTLNFGVRYMYQRPWTFRDHNATFFDFANNKLVLARDSSTSTLPPGANPTTPYLPDITFANPFPSSLAVGVSPNPSVNVVDRDFRNAVTQQWNLTAEHQVRENWSFRASYVGSQSHHLLVNGSYDIDVP